MKNEGRKANGVRYITAAKAALRRKKTYEHSLEQTQGQIMTLEREIYSIETANINKETLEAMKNASKAMKDIHGGLTIEKVDQTMYVLDYSEMRRKSGAAD
jgi:charged multivesicular body protein 4